MTLTAQAPIIPVARPCIGEEEAQEVLAVLRSGWVSQGPKVAEFERSFAQYVGTRHAIAVSSCTTALHLALIAAGVRPGDEVICPSLSFIATANAIAYCGATPVFADVDVATYNMTAASVESAITPRTRAILVVHQIGLPAPLDSLMEIAAHRGLVVVEDAACAIGAEYHARRIGLPHTTAACFSFHPRKILTTGEGGMITTSDEELATRMRRLRQHAMSVSDLVRHGSNKVVAETYDELGYNYRMTDMQAALGKAQLGRLDGMLAKRRQLAERYTERLARVPWVIPPIEPAGCKHNYQSYMVRLASDAPVERDVLMQRLLDRGVSTRRGVMAIHRERPYRGTRMTSLPATDLITDTTMILPVFHEMTEGEQDRVIDSLEDAAGE